MNPLQKAFFDALNEPLKFLAGGLVLRSPAAPLKGYEFITLLVLQSKAVCTGIRLTGDSGSNL